MVYDVIISNGLVYDGSLSPPKRVDVGVMGDRIAFIGDLSGEDAETRIDANGLVVSPGFINMLSWSVDSLIFDGRALSTITQGVTLEVMGESFSMGPLNERVKREFRELLSLLDDDFVPSWTWLHEYLEFLENKGVATNVASFVGTGTIRLNVLGYDARSPTDNELEEMKQLVEHEMKHGAMGLGSALIYPPDNFYKTRELIELAKVAAKYDGMYISHIRSEGKDLEKAVNELITIAREAGIRAEIYHLKASGKDNWRKLDTVIQLINDARTQGLAITTDCYVYTAGSTGLASCLPPWLMDGGIEKFIERLKNPHTREALKQEMLNPSTTWENLYYDAGPENILILNLENPENKRFSGRTVKDIADTKKQDPRDTVIDLLITEHGRVQAIYFLMNEENIKKKIQLPYMSFCSDAPSLAPEGKMKEIITHPRAYGNFARILGKYVREEKVISLKEAIHKLTLLPATNLKLKDRGQIKSGYYADIVVFDPDTIIDKATYKEPHQLSKGVMHVLVNGVQVLKNGVHTGKFPGRFVKGPGVS